MTLLLVATMLVFAAPACGGGNSTDPATYEATDLVSGADVSVASLRGSPVLLISWTTWCNECDKELSRLQTFAESEVASGIEIIAVNLDAADVSNEIDAKIEDHGLTTILWRDRRNDFKREFSAIGVPTTVLLDERGLIVGTFPGAVDFTDADFVDALNQVGVSPSP